MKPQLIEETEEYKIYRVGNVDIVQNDQACELYDLEGNELEESFNTLQEAVDFIEKGGK